MPSPSGRSIHFTAGLEDVSLQSRDPVQVIEREMNLGVNALLQARVDQRLRSILLGEAHESPVPLARMGLVAQFEAQGFRPDGSSLLAARWIGPLQGLACGLALGAFVYSARIGCGAPALA